MNSIVTISGTSRPDNYTSLALAVVEDELKNIAKASVTHIDARELSLTFPGFPETEDAKRLQAIIKKADGVVLASPEYHGSFCAMTKLILENLDFPSVLEGKPIALLGVASGRIGAIKSLEHLRSVCGHIGAIVVPGAVSVAAVQKAFDLKKPLGHCLDKDTEKTLRGLGHSLLKFIQNYVCPMHVLESQSRSDKGSLTTNV